MNVQAMMKQVQKAQQEMEKVQAEIEATVFEGSVGGVITLKMYGTKVVESLTIKPEAMDDAEELAEMIVMVTNNVMKEIDAVTEERMGKLTKGLNVPGLF